MLSSIVYVSLTNREYDYSKCSTSYNLLKKLPFIKLGKMMQKQNFKILIVDDHMIMRSVVEKHISALGMRDTTFAVNGADALAKTKDETFDIILADWNMPEMDGQELLKEIRQDKKHDKSAFVMITAESEKDKKLEIMQSGATSYLTKPFSEELFNTTIKNVLSWIEEKRA